jgi:hypothetical protein
VSLYDGLGGPPIFCGLLVDQRRVDRAVGSGGFLFYACYCFCLFFLASVLSVLEMQVSPWSYSFSWFVKWLNGQLTG